MNEENQSTRATSIHSATAPDEPNVYVDTPRPLFGRTVIVVQVGEGRFRNDQVAAPAIVTGIVEGDRLNLRIFEDGEGPDPYA